MCSAARRCGCSCWSSTTASPQFPLVRESYLWPAFREVWFCARLAFALSSTAYIPPRSSPACSSCSSAASCATSLACSEPIEALHAGVVIYRAALGNRVQPGRAIADLVDVGTGAVTTLAARASGRLYARGATRWAAPGQRLAKIAGTTLMRRGKLLSP